MKLIVKTTLSIFLYAIFSNQAVAQSNYTLQQALQTARSNNPVLKTEQFNISISEADIVTAELRPNFVLNNQTLQLMQSAHFPQNAGWANAQNRQVWWQLTKTFQVAGQRKNKIDFATKNTQFSKVNFTETERNLYSEVAAKWLEVWTAKKQLDIINIAKNNIDSLVATNQNRFKNQVITETDLLRTELLSKQYGVQLKSALQEVANRQNELKFLLGVSGSVSVDTADSYLFAMPQSIDSLLAQSLRHRSDVLAAKSMIEVSNSNIKLQKSLAYPQPEIGLIYNPQNSISYFGVYATIDLPFSSRNQGEIKKSHLLKGQAEQHLFTVQNQLQTEVQTAYASYKLQEQNVENFNAILKQSQSILDNVKYAYLRGRTSVIDFLEAQRSWLETQQQYYETLQLYRQNYIQLLYTTGLINQLAL